MLGNLTNHARKCIFLINLLTRFNYDRSSHYSDASYKQWTIKFSLVAKLTCKIIFEQFTVAYLTYPPPPPKKKERNMLGIKTLILQHLTTETLLLSQTRLSFKNREISNFYIISHFRDQRSLRRVCAFS